MILFLFTYCGLGYGIVAKTSHRYKILTFDSNKEEWYPNEV
jgi:hypothetical protein